MSISLNLFAQVDGSFKKTFSDGSQIFSQDYTITEFKSRPVDVNVGIPDEKLFDRQEWKLRSYELWLQMPNNQKPKLFWVFNDEYEITQRKNPASRSGFAIRDIYFSEPNSYVLYMTGFGLVVAKVENRENIGWTTFPVILMEREYGFRHIVNAKFKKGKKPEIEAEYLSDETDELGTAKKVWTWKLKNDKWEKTRK